MKQEAEVHFNKIGSQVDRKLHCLLSASVEKLTYYSFHQKRSLFAMNDIGLL